MAEYGNDSDNLINLDQQYGSGPHTFYALAGNGLVLGLLFLALEAPDVALSEIAVGTAVTPFLFLVALAAIATDRVGR